MYSYVEAWSDKCMISSLASGWNPSQVTYFHRDYSFPTADSNGLTR